MRTSRATTTASVPEGGFVNSKAWARYAGDGAGQPRRVGSLKGVGSCQMPEPSFQNGAPGLQNCPNWELASGNWELRLKATCPHVADRGGRWVRAPGLQNWEAWIDHCLLTSAATLRNLGTGDWELGTPADGHVPSRGDAAQASNLTLETSNFPCAGWGHPAFRTGDSA